jgi:hypothetical protein
MEEFVETQFSHDDGALEASLQRSTWPASNAITDYVAPRPPVKSERTLAESDQPGTQLSFDSTISASEKAVGVEKQINEKQPIEKQPIEKPLSKALLNGVDPNSLLARLHRALGPLAGAFILDFTDLVTLGPIGLGLGLMVGGAVGWWISSIYGLSRRQRSFWTLLSGIYCTLPFTAIFPFATLLSAATRFQKDA